MQFLSLGEKLFTQSSWLVNKDNGLSRHAFHLNNADHDQKQQTQILIYD